MHLLSIMVLHDPWLHKKIIILFHYYVSEKIYSFSYIYIFSNALSIYSRRDLLTSFVPAGRPMNYIIYSIIFTWTVRTTDHIISIESWNMNMIRVCGAQTGRHLIMDVSLEVIYIIYIEWMWATSCREIIYIYDLNWYLTI